MITPRAIVYQGPSLFEPEHEITAVLNLGMDGNDKTGGLTQLYILPTEALYGDAAPIRKTKELSNVICGTCPLRSKATGGNGQCYAYGTVLLNGAFAVQRAVKAGRVADKWYPPYDILRSAAIGDPAALPPDVMLRLIGRFREVRGYTQRWRTALHLRPTHMASVHSVAEALEARAMGWRTFRIGPVAEGEVRCPASKEMGHKTSCARCTLCTGQVRPTAPSVAILDHGPWATHPSRNKRRVLEAA